MSTYIIKIEANNAVGDSMPLYGMWSDTSDTPTTKLKHLSMFVHYYEHMYGVEGLRELPERLERAFKTGCSARDCTGESMMNVNRYGEDEVRLSVDEVVDKWKAESEGVSTSDKDAN